MTQPLPSAGVLHGGYCGQQWVDGPTSRRWVQPRLHLPTRAQRLGGYSIQGPAENVPFPSASFLIEHLLCARHRGPALILSDPVNHRQLSHWTDMVIEANPQESGEDPGHLTP